MTIFAGIFARKQSFCIPERTRRALRDHISRTPRDAIFEISSANLHIVKLNIGALSGIGVVEDAHANVSVLAGETHYTQFSSSTNIVSRDDDLSRLHTDWNTGDWKNLRKCSGTFSAIHYSSAKNSIALISDRLGVRPIYYFISPEYVVFSTALRVLTELYDIVPLVMDIRGVAETACFGQALAERTAYADIKRIREAEVVEVGQGSIDKTTYWRWDHVSQTIMSQPDVIELAYENFVSAIKVRLGGDQVSAAFLSGGLDSRAIVSILRMLNVNVHTTNWAEPDSQDYVFGKSIANALGCLHQDTPKTLGEREGDPYKARGVAQWLQSAAVKRVPLQRPKVVWSGDGGSVGVGHVYLNAAAVNKTRSLRNDEAVIEFLRYNNWGLPNKLFTRKWAERITAFPQQGMLKELSRFDCEDPGRSLHLFLMANDQRRHNTLHFENLDLDRVELLMPFFDSHFVETILSCSVDYCLRHSFYLDWLKHFPSATLSVPWQAYPNHEPCPLPTPTQLAYQWRKSEAIKKVPKETKSNAWRSLVTLSRRIDFPSQLISRPQLLAASTASALGIKDYGYALRVAEVFGQYWEICEGKFIDS